jgi:hypothetical protein
VPGGADAFDVDERELRLPTGWTGTLDVNFDGRRIFSVDPQRHRAGRDGRRTVRWPAQVRAYLTGRTRLSITEHATGRVLGEQEVAFGTSDARIAVVDAEGHPLAADKWGRLSRTFSSLGGEHGSRLLDDVEALLADVREVLGVPVFIAYGTLLGAVREGDFIGHDTDADIAYLSERGHPADIAAEAFRLQRELVARGWRTHRSTTTFLQVWREDGDGEPNRIDIFTAYFVGDTFALDCWVRGRLRRADIAPLGEVRLAGRALPAPAEPEPLLALTYGPGWRTPDPAFRFAVPRSTSARAYGYFNRPFVFDAISVDPALQPPAPDEPLRPSPFAQWVDAGTDDRSRIVHVRLGVGHDATWLATRGRTVLAFDVKENSQAHRTDRLELADRLRFERLSIHELRRTVARAAGLVAEDGRPPVLAVDRALEALRPGGRANLWLLARMVLGAGGTLYLETGDERTVPGVLRAVRRLGGAVREPGPVADGDAVRVVADFPRHVESSAHR